MAEHPAEIEKADDGQRDLLELALRPVAQDWHEHDCRNHVRRQGGEEPVPPREIQTRVGHVRGDPQGQYRQVDEAG